MKTLGHEIDSDDIYFFSLLALLEKTLTPTLASGFCKGQSCLAPNLARRQIMQSAKVSSARPFRVVTSRFSALRAQHELLSQNGENISAFFKPYGFYEKPFSSTVSL